MSRSLSRVVGGLAASYVRPPVQSYTDACEAPVAMWNGAITLRRVAQPSHGSAAVVKTYTHPPERHPNTLAFTDINTMYCIGNDELVQYFPEGVGGKVMQTFVPGHPRGFLYRKQSHLLRLFIEKIRFFDLKQEAIDSLTDGRPGLIFDGETGTGKSALLCQAVHYARSNGIFTLYVPNARVWTHGEWCWPSTLLPGFFDVPDAARFFLQYFAAANRTVLSSWKLRKTPLDLPTDAGEKPPATLLDLCEWGHRALAPASVDRQSVALKFVMDELKEESTMPMLFVVDGWNLFSHETHFRFPHPDFWRTMASFQEANTDIDLYPQEMPRIPSSRLSFVRALNAMVLAKAAEPNGKQRNKFFVTCTTRDFKPFDGVSGFPDVETDKHRSSLDEYAPYYPAKDSPFLPMAVENFDEYEYRSYLRFLVNSGELAGLGWGPLWHYSSPFERKLAKIDFMSDRNPQRVIDHYHQEIVWRHEYYRMRQKQFITNTRNRRAVRGRE